MTEPIKIAYFIGSMRRGGAEGQVLELLRRFRGDGFSASLYLLNEIGEHLPEVRELRVPIKSFDFESRHRLYDPRAAANIFSLINRVGRALRDDRPDVLHCFLYWANIFGVAAGRRAGIPRIITSRRSLGLFKDGRGWMQTIENWTNRRVDAVTANSHAVAADTLAREKIDPEKIHVIHNGVAEPKQANADARSDFLERVGLNDDLGSRPPVIVYVANLIHYKGHLCLIDAMARVVEQCPEARLVLVGRDGGMEALVRERIRTHGIESKVMLAGLLSPPAPAYEAADLVVHASDEEGFPNAVLEAMSWGKPVVATRVGGIPEALKDGEEGLLVKPGDSEAMSRAIIRLINDPAERRRKGEAARRRAREEFSIARMISEYESLYRELAR